MVNLYTAVGRCEYIESEKSFNIVVGNEAKRVSQYERIIWSISVWGIKTKQEIEEKFNHLIKNYSEPNDSICFDDLFIRLQTRKLIVSGSGVSGRDSLYNLLKQLTIIPIRKNMFLFIIAYIDMLIKHKSITKVNGLLLRPKMTPDEKRIFNIAKRKKISADDLYAVISKLETGAEAGDIEIFEKQRMAVLNSINGLCEKRMILFDLKGVS